MKLSVNVILTSIKGHNSLTNLRKMTANNPKVELVSLNSYIKFGENLSICSKDIEQKQNFGVNQGHNSGTNEQNMMCNNVAPVNMIAYKIW